MALQSFIGIVILNEDGSPASGVTATIYAKSDTTLTTPLTAKDASGSPISLTAGIFGRLPDFFAETSEPAVWVKAGTSAAQIVMSVESLLDFVPGVTSVNGRTGAVTLGKTDVGLSAVDNTSDANKPVSTATATALAGKAALVHTHALADVTGLVAALAGKLSTTDPLDPTLLSAVVPTSKLGSGFADSTKVLYGDGTWKTAPTGGGSGTGGAVDSVNGKTGTVVLTYSDVGALPSTYTAPVLSVAGKTGAVALVKADVGLSSVDNTADADKPLSNATTAALAAKAADADVVHKAGAETISGLKAFAVAPVVPDASWSIAKTAGLQSALDAKAGVSGGITGIQQITAAAYAALSTKVTTTLYVVVG